MENITVDAKKIVVYKKNKTFEGFTDNPKLKINVDVENIIILMLKEDIDKEFSFNSDNQYEIEKLIVDVEENEMKQTRYKFTRYRDVFKWFEFLQQLSSPPENETNTTENSPITENQPEPTQDVKNEVVDKKGKKQDTFYE